MCALLYDEEDCDGWEYEVPIGYSELPSFSFSGPKRNDAESVLVRPGCKFIGKQRIVIKRLPISHITSGNWTGCRTGNREKLSSSQAEPGQAIKSAVA